MEFVANYYALTDEQVRLYQALAQESSKNLTEALKALPADENFVSIGGLWDGLHYFINNQDSDPMGNYLAEDNELAIYCSFFGGEWLQEMSNDDDNEDWSSPFANLIQKMFEDSNTYFTLLNRSDEVVNGVGYNFLYLSVINANLISEIVKALKDIDIKKCCSKYPEPNTFGKYRLTPYLYWEKQSNEFLLQEFESNFLKFQKFYQNALKNNRSVLIAIC